MHFKKASICSLVLGLCFLRVANTFSQDIQFSQFYANPLYQNPAFAGSSYMHRVVLHQRLQWMALDARYATSFVSWDKDIEKLRGGIGVYFLHDFQGGSKIVSDEVAGQYAYEVPISNKFVLRAGVQAVLGWRTVDYSQFKYAQDYNDQGYQGNTYNQYGNSTFWYGDLSSGLVFFSNKLWLGLAANHMNEPSQTFYNNVSNRLPMKLSFTGGYKFIIKKISPKFDFHGRVQEFSVTPTFLYKAQGKSDQFDMGVYSQLDRLLLGFWYRGIPFKRYDVIQNNESMVFLAGVKYMNVAFTYSYDFTVSRLARANTGGSHEFNITLYFARQKQKTRPMRRLPCPDFFD
jgi:type IX secretion system PorP/SprF family membrane protein